MECRLNVLLNISTIFLFQFFGEKEVRKHQKRVHSNVRDHHCWKCPKTFTEARSLNQHLVRVHKEVLANEDQMKIIELSIGKK